MGDYRTKNILHQWLKNVQWALYSIVMILMFPAEVSAATQEKEVIVYRGIKTEIDSEKLRFPQELTDTLNKWKEACGPKGNDYYITTAYDSQGYKGFWSISDNRLFLDSLYLSDSLQKGSKFRASEFSALNTFLEGDRIFASWISDTLTVLSNPEVIDEAERMIVSNGIVKNITKTTYVFSNCNELDQFPVFPGGEIELFRYLTKNLIFPNTKQDNNVRGRAVAEFIIEKDGSISNIRLLNSFGNTDYDQEFIRVIKSFPIWTPGRKGGHAVRCKFILPLNVHWR